MEYFDLMSKAFSKEHLDFNEDKYNKYIRYMELLKEWNEKINLTAITEDEQIIKKHFIDSIKCFEFKGFQNCSNIIDVGTGAGFPGLPIKIADESKKVTLVDSLNKRVRFLNEVIKNLNLSDIETIHSRAEDLSRKKEHREQYDAAVSRAVANMAVLSEYCLPYVKVGGYFIALKGPSIEEELKTSKNSIKIFGGKLEQIIQVDIEDTDLKHNIVVIKKISSTPAAYPRKASEISKKSLG